MNITLLHILNILLVGCHLFKSNFFYEVSNIIPLQLIDQSKSHSPSEERHIKFVKL
jgi:hypothetical protein